MDLHMNQSHLPEFPVTFYLDDMTTAVCTWALYTVVCQLINLFGIAANIINIFCFVKQGLNNSTNICLLGLSISDLGSVTTTVGICILFTPAVAEADLPFESSDIMYLVFAMPHLSFVRVSSCITALISLERCLSIVAPLKVKQIITPDRAAKSVACIFIIFTISSTPVYIVNKLSTQFSFTRNKTIVGLIFTHNKELVEMYTLSINNFFIPFCAFVIIAVCTVILTAQLRKNSKWRKTAANDLQTQNMSIRNKKVAKIVVSISTLFICCFVPVSIMVLAIGFVPGLSINGKYFNASTILCGWTLILESLNSSVNIFIYHSMSTKYRDIFRKLF